ncbi:MAG: GTPase-activating protein gyp8, partial [Marteilia pararefringens]
EEVLSNHNYSLVKKDILRCQHVLNKKYSDVESLEKIITLIVKLLIRNEELNYYQGFHEIICFFVISYDTIDNLGYLIEHIAFTKLRFMMNPSLKELNDYGNIIINILKNEDQILEQHLNKIGFTPNIYLSYFLTWFVHDVMDHSFIQKIFEFYLNSDCLMPYYLFAAIVIIRRQEFMSYTCMEDFFVNKKELMQQIDVDYLIDLSKSLYENYARGRKPLKQLCWSDYFKQILFQRKFQLVSIVLTPLCLIIIKYAINLFN